MLSGKDLREYRDLKELSLRDVAEYCNLSPQYIGEIERGEKSMTENAHDEIANGINRAYAAKVNGTFERKTPANPKLKAKEEPEKKKVTKSVKR